MNARRGAAVAAALALALTGCGSNGSAGFGGEVGTYDPDAADLALGSGEAGGLTVSIGTSQGALCPGQCATLSVQAGGGTAPYSYRWDPDVAADGGAATVCPTGTTTYAVTATDGSRSSGEGLQAARTGQAQVTLTVTPDCLDAAAQDVAIEAGSEAAGGTCDGLDETFSSAGANPSGAWSYGEERVLGSTFFTRFDTFTASSKQVTPDATNGLAEWYAGLINTPAVLFNDTGAVVTSVFECPVEPRQFVMVPDQLFNVFVAARWTAPTSGTVGVHATLTELCTLLGEAGTGPIPTDVHVQHNGTDIGTGYLDSDGGGTTTSFALDVDVAAGDTIDFVVGGANPPGQNVFPLVALDAHVCAAAGGGGG
ncbi:MAG: hypothetical protein ACRENE_18265 [Polyangiaceae bacterium]